MTTTQPTSTLTPEQASEQARILAALDRLLMGGVWLGAYAALESAQALPQFLPTALEDTLDTALQGWLGRQLRQNALPPEATLKQYALALTQAGVLMQTLSLPRSVAWCRERAPTLWAWLNRQPSFASRDPRSAFLRALALHQTNRDLLPFWMGLCRQGQPRWVALALFGLRRMPVNDDGQMPRPPDRQPYIPNQPQPFTESRSTMTTQTTPILTPEQAAEQTRILRVGSGVEAYRFAYKVPGADIPALQARVLAVGTGGSAYVFACDVVGADIAACQARVLAVGTSEDIYHFARNVPDLSNADIMALQARVLTGGTAQEVCWFAQDVDGADIAACQARIFELALAYDIYEFALKIPGADIAACQAKVLELGDGLLASSFARDVKGADIATCQAHVMKVGEFYELEAFAKEVPGADIAVLQARVLELDVECGDGGFCAYSFAMSIPSADVEVLYTHAQAQGFAGLNEQQRAEFEALVAAYRAQRQQQATQAEVEIADDAGAGPDSPAA